MTSDLGRLLARLTIKELMRVTTGLKKTGVTSRESLIFGLAQFIFIHTLGPDFWAKECLNKFKGQQDFFREKFFIRVIHLSHMFWKLRRCEGFQNFLTKNDRKDFESI